LCVTVLGGVAEGVETTGNTLAWAVVCERDQWGRAIAGHVNLAPRHLITAEAETLLSATLIHEVMHFLYWIRPQCQQRMGCGGRGDTAPEASEVFGASSEFSFLQETDRVDAMPTNPRIAAG
jgi:hypothetical protein